jgi:hypothetical protein
MIRTDGISCCILFIRKDETGIPLKKTFKNKKCCEEINMDYIEKTIITKEMKNKKVIAIDPNLSDLIYSGSYRTEKELEDYDKENNIDINNLTNKQKHKRKLQTFRYTQNQRQKETRNRKYNKMIDKLNKETKINEKSIKELESVLSKLNSKTINFNEFKEYLIEKNKLNSLLFNYYQQKIFRKLKLNRFINMQKSEQKMIKNFRNKYGNKEDIIIIIGDYDKGDYNMKGKEPVICKKLRIIFKNAGYETYLINEFRTSMLCHCCNNETEKFIERLSHKPKLYKEDKKEIVYGLLRCQSIKPLCEIIHNRDKNAVQNMLNITKSIFDFGIRPEKFSRTTT